MHVRKENNAKVYNYISNSCVSSSLAESLFWIFIFCHSIIVLNLIQINESVICQQRGGVIRSVVFDRKVLGLTPTLNLVVA